MSNVAFILTQYIISLSHSIGPHRLESGDKVRRHSIRHLRSSDVEVEQSANDSQKFQHLVKLQICFEDAFVYLTIFSRLHQQLRSVTAPLNRFYVLWRHRNHRHRIIIIIIIIRRIGLLAVQNIVDSNCRNDGSAET